MLLQPAHGAAHRQRVGVDAGGDKRGHDRAGAVDVVRAPAAEPRTVGLLRVEQPPHAASAPPRVCAMPLCPSISTTCAVTSADGGSITAPKSQNGTFSTSRRVLSASNAPQPPSRDCMPTAHRVPRSTAAATSGRSLGRRPAQREHHLGGVVDVGVARRWRTRTPSPRRRGRAACTAQSPLTRTSSPSSQSTAVRTAGSSTSAPGVEQRDEREAGVPDRRLAGLEPPDRRRRASPRGSGTRRGP